MKAVTNSLWKRHGFFKKWSRILYSVGVPAWREVEMVIMGIFIEPCFVEKCILILFLSLHAVWFSSSKPISKKQQNLVSSQNFIIMSYLEENMLENESKCNNVTFGTQNSLFNMCRYSISVIFQFLKVTDSLWKITDSLWAHTLCHRFFTAEVTDSLWYL